jgi:predicted peptidase
MKHRLTCLAVMFKPWFLSILLIFVVGCNKQNPGDTNSGPASPYTLTPKPITISDHIKGFYEYLPEGYTTDASSTKYPLLIFFHGAVEAGTDLNAMYVHGPLKHVKNGSLPTSFTVNGKTYKFIIIAPQFTVTDSPYPDEVDKVIEYVKQNYRVDASRIYLTGLSHGGGVCWNYVGKNASYARKVAAMVPIASYINEAREDFKISAGKANVIAASNLPIWSTQNKNDNLSPLSWILNADSLIDNYKPTPKPLPKLTVFDEWGHEGWTKTYDPSFKENNMNIYEWMLQYHR